ncbi:MAG: hypothetical protein ABR878_12155 [Roseiarcus sp.]|jgi:hypothetical protein
MPREIVEMPVSREPLYEAVAVFSAVLAYPEHQDSRDRFAAAWCRATIRARAKKDEAYASELQPIRPGYFLMSDNAAKAAMQDAARRLAERKTAVIATHPLFEAAERGREIETIRAFAMALSNNAEGGAAMAMYLVRNHKNDDSKAYAKNLVTRVINPSRPVIHAAMAYWRIVLEARGMGVATDEEAERRILHDRDVFQYVIRLAEDYRQIAVSIPELRITEDDLIAFHAA